MLVPVWTLFATFVARYGNSAIVLFSLIPWSFARCRALPFTSCSSYCSRLWARLCGFYNLIWFSLTFRVLILALLQWTLVFYSLLKAVLIKILFLQWFVCSIFLHPISFFLLLRFRLRFQARVRVQVRVNILPKSSTPLPLSLSLSLLLVHPSPFFLSQTLPVPQLPTWVVYLMPHRLYLPKIDYDPVWEARSF